MNGAVKRCVHSVNTVMRTHHLHSSAEGRFKSIQSLGDRGTDIKRFAQAAALAKDALQRELIALQSNMDVAELAKQAEDHMDSVSSSREQSRYLHLSYRR